MWLTAGVLGLAFSEDPAVRRAVSDVAPIAAGMQPVAGVLFVMDGVYMALVRVRALAVSTAAGFVAMVTVAGVALRLDWGLSGVWWAMVAMVLARIAVLSIRYAAVFSETRD
jgi:Na+-driven multidrug efflux pump